ncbi:MAG: glutathione S-transferase family protein [Rhizobiales bacterium]|nr:glutathione S-transferase family protein [Hyphomicrobiales bacterium]
MKLHETARAPNPRRVRIFLAEKGITVETVEIDIMTSEHKAPDFARLNPVMRVPVLEFDDGTCLSESVAICRYYEALSPEPALFGVSPLEQAMVEMWNRRIEHGLYHHIAQGFRHTNPAMAPFEVPQVEEWGRANIARIDADLAFLDQALDNAHFIAGAGFSIADITLLVSLDFMRVLKHSVPPELGNLSRWYQNVKARPSAKA